MAHPKLTIGGLFAFKKRALHRDLLVYIKQDRLSFFHFTELRNKPYAHGELYVGKFNRVGEKRCKVLGKHNPV